MKDVGIIAKGFIDMYQPHHWCRRAHYLKLKKEKLFWNMLAALLVALGVIVGPIVTNALIVSGLTIAGTMVKVYLDFKRYDTLVEMSRFAYTTYAKALHNAQTLTTEEEIEKETEKMESVHETIIDLCPAIPNRISKRYVKEHGNVTIFIDGKSVERINTQLLKQNL